MESAEKNRTEVMSNYYVVEFINRGKKPSIKSIDIVVNSWLSYNHQLKKCVTKYPSLPHEDYEDFLLNMSPPADDWKTYSCKIRGRANTLNEAKLKADQLNDKVSALTTDSEFDSIEAEKQEMETIRRNQFLDSAKRFKSHLSESIANSGKSTFQSTNTDQTINQGTIKGKTKSKVVKSKSTGTKLPQQLPSTSFHANIAESISTEDDYSQKENSQEFGNRIGLCQKVKRKAAGEFSTSSSTVNSYSTHSQHIQGLQTIIGQQNEILAVLKCHSHDLQDIKIALAQKSKNDNTEVFSSLHFNDKYTFNLPLTTIEDFESFDDRLKNELSFSSDVMNILQAGLDHSLVISKCLVNMIKMFMTKEVAIQFVAIKKVPGKKVMKITHFYRLIEGLIKERRLASKLSVSDKEFHTALSSVLTNVSHWRSTNSTKNLTKNPMENLAENSMKNPTENSAKRIEEISDEELIGDYYLLPPTDEQMKTDVSSESEDIDINFQ